jgi:hypothetical protein
MAGPHNQPSRSVTTEEHNKTWVSLAGFAVAAETINVVDRAVKLGSQAELLRLDSVWFAQMASYDALSLGGASGRSPDLRRHRGSPDLSSAPADTRVCG